MNDNWDNVQAKKPKNARINKCHASKLVLFLCFFDTNTLFAKKITEKILANENLDFMNMKRLFNF